MKKIDLNVYALIFDTFEMDNKMASSYTFNYKFLKDLIDHLTFCKEERIENKTKQRNT